MPQQVQMKISFRRVQNNPNMFEFIIATPLMKTQFKLPRAIVNRLRIDLERALTAK